MWRGRNLFAQGSWTTPATTVPGVDTVIALESQVPSANGVRENVDFFFLTSNQWFSEIMPVSPRNKACSASSLMTFV
jgi:hypothetical protein